MNHDKSEIAMLALSLKIDAEKIMGMIIDNYDHVQILDAISSMEQSILYLKNEYKEDNEQNTKTKS